MSAARGRSLRLGPRLALVLAPCLLWTTIALFARARPSVTDDLPVEVVAREEPSRAAPEAPIAEAAPAARTPRYRTLDAASVEPTPRGDVHVVPAHHLREGHVPATFTMLHGACSDVAWTCERLAGATPDGFVTLCPTGNASCDGAADWHGEGEEKAAHLDQASAAVRAALELPESRGRDVLVGFSRGAFVARDVAYARPGRYRGLVLLGAALSPDPDKLRASGIQRVVMASGELDGAKPTMLGAVQKLRAAGIEVRWVSLGRVYHTLPPDSAKRLRDAMRWVSGDEPGAS